MEKSDKIFPPKADQPLAEKPKDDSKNEKKTEKDELENRESIKEILKKSDFYDSLNEDECEKLIDRIVEYHRNREK